MSRGGRLRKACRHNAENRAQALGSSGGIGSCAAAVSDGARGEESAHVTDAVNSNARVIARSHEPSQLDLRGSTKNHGMRSAFFLCASLCASSSTFEVSICGFPRRALVTNVVLVNWRLERRAKLPAGAGGVKSWVGGSGANLGASGCEELMGDCAAAFFDANLVVVLAYSYSRL